MGPSALAPLAGSEGRFVRFAAAADGWDGARLPALPPARACPFDSVALADPLEPPTPESPGPPSPSACASPIAPRVATSAAV